MIKKIYNFLFARTKERNSYNNRLKRAEKITAFRPWVPTRLQLHPIQARMYAEGDIEGIRAYVRALHNKRILNQQCQNFGSLMCKSGISIKRHPLNIGISA